MTGLPNLDVVKIAGSLVDGPRVDERNRRELGGEYVTCRGCPSLRVFDFHYFYCRRLGDQSFPDAWNKGWERLWRGTDHRVASEVPCLLPLVADADDKQVIAYLIGDEK